MGRGAVAAGRPGRVRLLCAPGNALGQSASRQGTPRVPVHIPWNGWHETDFRTPAVSATIISRTIHYTYDPLGRLVEADYSTGESFEYEYDAATVPVARQPRRDDEYYTSQRHRRHHLHL